MRTGPKREKERKKEGESRGEEERSTDGVKQVKSEDEKKGEIEDTRTKHQQ